MSNHITGHRQGFPHGFTAVTGLKEREGDTGIAFGVLNLAAGERHEARPGHETAWLLMSGDIEVTAGSETRRLRRRSLFDESASAVHVAAGERVAFLAKAASELTVYEIDNPAAFAPRIYGPDEVPNEHRGKGQVGDACYRFVRTIFDRRNADPASQMVLGEVITFPGRWSSYPPHHHAQPEIYHYRFTRPEGYGHAEMGEAVVKVRDKDTIKIMPGLDHAQCAAPGYGMYYAWVIRHLPDNPYTIPEFTADYRWTTAPDADFWKPAGIDDHGR
jgi:5-deoxy-glucuronate isomerase